MVGFKRLKIYKRDSILIWKSHLKQKIESGTPGGIRIPDLQDRNLLLYPAELRTHNGGV